MSRMPGRRTATARRGFTLLELVVVMAILVILAGVAIRSMEGLDQQARFEATQRCMQDINDAVVATGRDADGSSALNGFVADLGRLPRAVGPDPAAQLAELWSNPRNLAPFAIRPAPSDSEVLVASGWRGNYLRLGVGKSVLQDGWGRAFDLLKADGVTPVSDGDDIVVIRSRGGRRPGRFRVARGLRHGHHDRIGRDHSRGWPGSQSNDQRTGLCVRCGHRATSGSRPGQRERDNPVFRAGPGDRPAGRAGGHGGRSVHERFVLVRWNGRVAGNTCLPGQSSDSS